MEEVIARSGMFVERGFGAVGTLRVDEVLFQEHVNERFIGWDVRTGVRFEAVTKDSDTPRQDPGMSLRVRYSRPVGWKSQFDISAQYTSPFTGDFGDIYTLSLSLNYLYEVTNRVDFTLSNIITSTRSEPDVDAILVGQVRSGFIFFIENQINLNVTGTIAKTRGEDATQSLNMAIEYPPALKNGRPNIERDHAATRLESPIYPHCGGHKRGMGGSTDAVFGICVTL